MEGGRRQISVKMHASFNAYIKCIPHSGFKLKDDIYSFTHTIIIIMIIIIIIVMVLLSLLQVLQNTYMTTLDPK